jgi:hypothetical protein
LGLLLGLGGCDLTGTQVLRVSGTVTRGGKPVANLSLNFKPVTGRPSWGITNDRGRYILHYDKARDGAVPGWHKVWVTFNPYDPREERLLEGRKLPKPEHLQEILAKYGNPDTTPLRFEIQIDDQVIDLPLD